MRSYLSSANLGVLAVLCVVASFLSTPLAAQQRYGLLIGNDYKGNTAGIPPLDLCEKDAKLMQSTLRKHGNFTDVKVLLGRMVTEKNLKAAINDLAKKAGPRDTVVLFFAGHGDYYPDKQAPNGLRNMIIMFERPHVTDDVLNRWLKRIPTSKVVWVFDCCFAGGIAKKGKKARAGPGEGGPKKKKGREKAGGGEKK